MVASMLSSPAFVQDLPQPPDISAAAICAIVRGCAKLSTFELGEKLPNLFGEARAFTPFLASILSHVEGREALLAAILRNGEGP